MNDKLQFVNTVDLKHHDAEGSHIQIHWRARSLWHRLSAAAALVTAVVFSSRFPATILCSTAQVGQICAIRWLRIH